MKDLKLSKEEKTGNTPVEQNKDSPEYPFGLQIHLTENELNKIGIKNLPEPGTKLTAATKLRVIGAMIHDGPDGQHKSLHLQITHMAIGDEKEGYEKTDGESQSKKLYGSDKK